MGVKEWFHAAKVTKRARIVKPTFIGCIVIQRPAFRRDRLAPSACDPLWMGQEEAREWRKVRRYYFIDTKGRYFYTSAM